MQVELHPEAQAETRRAAIWYDERQLGLGDRFLAAVTGTLAGIAATPRAYPIWVALKRPPCSRHSSRIRKPVMSSAARAESGSYGGTQPVEASGVAFA